MIWVVLLIGHYVFTATTHEVYQLIHVYPRDNIGQYLVYLLFVACGVVCCDQIIATSVKLLCFILSQLKCPQVIIFSE